MPDLVGLVPAADGAGRSDGERLRRAVRLLDAAGCERVLVALPADADAEALPAGATAVRVDGARTSPGAAAAAGIAALPEADAALLIPPTPFDLPRAVVDRVLDEGTARDVLARAVFDGEPGHPVLLGRDHWAAFRDALRGGRADVHLEEHDVVRVECGDLVRLPPREGR